MSFAAVTALGSNEYHETNRDRKFPVPAKIPCSGIGKSLFGQSRELPAARWNCSANGRRNPAESAEMARDFNISLLISLFSGNAGARP